MLLGWVFVSTTKLVLDLVALMRMMMDLPQLQDLRWLLKQGHLAQGAAVTMMLFGATGSFHHHVILHLLADSPCLLRPPLLCPPLVASRWLTAGCRTS
jgi:hypothetical protein